jgi:hypothetical protein
VEKSFDSLTLAQDDVFGMKDLSTPVSADEPRSDGSLEMTVAG